MEIRTLFYQHISALSQKFQNYYFYSIYIFYHMSRSHNRDTLNNLNVELKLASNVLVSEKSIICQWCSWKKLVCWWQFPLQLSAAPQFFLSQSMSRLLYEIMYTSLQPSQTLNVRSMKLIGQSGLEYVLQLQV